MILIRALLALRAWVRKARYAIEQQSESNDAADEVERNKDAPAEPVKVIVSFDDQTVRDAKTGQQEQNRIQRSIRNAAWLAFGAASVYALVAAYQYRTQIRSMRIDDRPWIGWNSYSGHVHYPKFDDMFFDFSFKNLGKTPALNAEVRMNYKIVPKGPNGEFNFTRDDIQFRPKRRDNNEWNSFVSGTVQPTLIWTLPTMHFQPISTEEWKQLLDDDKRLYFFIEIKYHDVFGRPLESHFCDYYTKLAPPVTECSFYNDTSPEP